VTLYDFAKLIQRMRKAQTAFFAATKETREVRDALLLKAKKLECQVDQFAYECADRSPFEELVELVEKARTAQQGRTDKHATNVERMGVARDQERRLDRKVEAVCERFETTPSLFDQPQQQPQEQEAAK
jgi:uncharacterized protein YqgV (UPF0045/DUF77 family)